MLIRQETEADHEAIDRVHNAAFGKPGDKGAIDRCVEAELVRGLRSDSGWIGELALVAEDETQHVIGHVVCTAGRIGQHSALGLGPIGVVPTAQGTGVGSGLMHAVLTAADALAYPVVVLLGHTSYYPRFGFVPARSIGITPPNSAWGESFQARPLRNWTPTVEGTFHYAAPFDAL